MLLMTPAEYEALMAGYITFIIIAGLIGFAINIAIMVYVYKDAEKRNMGGALWLIIIFFTGCLGLIIFLIVRGNHPG